MEQRFKLVILILHSELIEQKLAMQASASLNKEKANHTSLQKQYQDKIAVQNQEIQALRSKMQLSMDQHMSERTNMQSRMQQMEHQLGDKSVLHKLSEVQCTCIYISMVGNLSNFSASPGNRFLGLSYT